MIRQQGGTATAIKLAMRSRELYIHLGEELRLDNGFRETGYYVLAESQHQIEDFAKLVELRRNCGLQNEWIDSQEGARRFPMLNWGCLHGATFTKNDGYVTPSVVVRNITLGVLRTGSVDLFEGCPVESVDASDHNYRVRTPRGVFESPRLINAAGPRGFRDVNRLVGIENLAITASRHQIIAFPHVDEMADSPWPMALALSSGFYIRPFEHGIMLGMTNPKEPFDESTPEQMELDWEYYETLRPQWEKLIPALVDRKISQIWTAAVDCSPDHLPILDEPRLGYYVVSAGSHGMMNGPGLAECLADFIVEGRISRIPEEQVRQDRFHQPLKYDPICLSPTHETKSN